MIDSCDEVGGAAEWGHRFLGPVVAHPQQHAPLQMTDRRQIDLPGVFPGCGGWGAERPKNQQDAIFDKWPLPVSQSKGSAIYAGAVYSPTRARACIVCSEFAPAFQ